MLFYYSFIVFSQISLKALFISSFSFLLIWNPCLVIQPYEYLWNYSSWVISFYQCIILSVRCIFVLVSRYLDYDDWGVSRYWYLLLSLLYGCSFLWLLLLSQDLSHVPPGASSSWWVAESNRDVPGENAERDFGKKLKEFCPHQVARSPWRWRWSESRCSHK